MLYLAKLVPLIVLLLPLAASAQRGVTSPDPATSDANLRPGAAVGDRKLTLLPIRDSTYGTRNVSYFEVDGMAIIDGDVIYGSVNQLRAQDLARNPQVQESRAFSGFTSIAWPGATVTYRYDSDDTATALIPIVDAAIARWRATAPYLTFTRLLPNGGAGANGVTTIRATPCGGCNSHIGWANAPRSMNLQQDCPASPGWCGVNEATHEFGHLLGLYHEHQRPDREGTVNYQCQNVNPNCPTGTSMPAGKTCCDGGLPAGCCSTIGNFNIIDTGSVDRNGPYDVTSIMQYRADAFARAGTNTLTPAAPGVIIPTTNPSNPSTRDFNRICKLYSAFCPKAAPCRAADCPTTCAIINFCNKPSLCNSDFAPPCCNAEELNEACLAKRAQCATMDCDFLRQ